MAEKKTVLALALGTAFAASLAAAPAINAADNPFKMDSLKNGHQVADNKSKEGKCGEAKCGGDMTKKEGDKGKEASCGGNK